MGEMSLLIFSFALQSAIGIMVFLTLGLFLYENKVFKKAAFTAAGLSVLGVLASLAHLGQPLSAFNALFNIGSSWLSREVLLSGMFMGLAVLYALLVQFKADAHGLRKAVGCAGSVVGLVDVLAMGKLYASTSVPVWQGINTYVDFYATAIAVGALLFLVLSYQELKNESKTIYALAVIASVIIQAAVAIPASIELSGGGMAAQASAEILQNMAVVIFFKWLLILGGAAIMLWSSLAKGQEGKTASPLGVLSLSVLALIGGQLIGRYTFYVSMVVTSIGLT